MFCRFEKNARLSDKEVYPFGDDVLAWAENMKLRRAEANTI